MRKTKWASMIALTAALLAGLTGVTAPAAAAAPSTNEVHNTGTIAIGAVRFLDYDYTNGKYDDLIPPGRFSGYFYTDGIYVGPGYCVRIRAWKSGTEQDPPDPSELLDPIIVRAPGPGGVYHEFDIRYFGFDVRALPLTNPDCYEP